MHFHLDSLWHAEEGAMEFALTNCGTTPVTNPRLVYATLTRCLRPSNCTGARLVRRQRVALPRANGRLSLTKTTHVMI